MLKAMEIQRLLRASFDKELTNMCKRHIVFWYDEDGEFLDEVRELELDDVRIWSLTEHNLFAMKYELETIDPDSHFLIYANMAKPAPRKDWLFSNYMLGTEFSTDKTTVFKTLSYNKLAKYHLVIEDEMSNSIYEKIPFSIDITS